MKKLWLFLIVGIFMIGMFGIVSALTEEWVVEIGPSSALSVLKGISVDDDYVYVSGTDNTDDDNRWRVEKRSKIDASLIWSKLENPTSNSDRANAVFADDDGFLYIAGFSDGYKWRIAKRRKDTGEASPGGWTKTSSDITQITGASVIKTDENYVYIAGVARVGEPDDYYCLIEKRRKSDGGIVWSKHWDPADSYMRDKTPKTIVLDDSYVYVVLLTGDLARFDKGNGDLLWEIDTEGAARSMDIDDDSSGGFVYVSGGSAASEKYTEKRKKIDGSLVWKKVLGVAYSSVSYNGKGVGGTILDGDYLYISGGSGSGPDQKWHLQKLNIIDGEILSEAFSSNFGAWVMEMAQDEDFVYITGNYGGGSGFWSAAKWAKGEITNTCSFENDIIMKLSQPMDGLGAFYDKDYTWDICCSTVFGEDNDECSSDTFHPNDCTKPVGWLKDKAGSQISTTATAEYTFPVCYGDLECRQTGGNCNADEKVVVKLTDTTDSNILDPNYAESQGTFDINICCKKVVDVPEVLSWEDMDGNLITEANLGNQVRMVRTGAAPGDFEIFDDDGVGEEDDDIRVDDDSIRGVDEDGDLVGVWTITQADFDLGIADDDDDHIEAVFRIGEESSDALNVYGDWDDKPMIVTLDDPLCADDFLEGKTTTITVTASDPTDKIIGNISIDGVNIMNFSNEVKSTSYKWERAGNVQVELFAVNSKGYLRRTITSVMVVGDGSADYVAACISKPADFSDITSSKVEFDASNSKGLRCEDNGDCEDVYAKDLWFSWRFSDGLINSNHEGSNELSYAFFKNFATAGHNWAILDVEMR